MAEKLSIQIALDGGAEIERQLANIGAAGQKAFADISKSAEKVGFKNIKPEEVTAKLQEMGVTGVDAIDKIQRAVQQAGRLEGLVSGIATAENALLAMAKAAPIVGVAVVAAMTVAVKATIKFAETIQKASAEAVKLGLTLEQFDKQRQGLEKLGLSTQAATQGLQELGKAVEQVKLDAIVKAIKELEEASARGFGAQGTAQLKLLEEAAQGVGKGAELARAELEKLGLTGARKIEFGMAIPPGMVLTLKEFITVMGDGDKAMQAFQAQLRGMPDGLQRTNLAIAGMGPAGLQFIQALRLAEGSMSPVEAKAETLRQATERLSTEWGKFGSLTFSPAVVQGVDAATASIRGLDSVLTSMNWSAVGTAASVALNPLPNLIQLLGAAIVNLGSQFSGAGQAATQAGQQGAQGVQALTAAAGSAAQQMALLGQTSAQAGQQAAQGLQLMANPLTGMPELINTTNQALAQTGTTGTTSFGQVTTAAQTSNSTLSTFASTLAGWNWDPIAAGVRVWNDITGAIQGAIASLLQYLGLQQKTPAPAPKAAGGGQFARGGLLGGRGSGTSDSNLAWLSRGEFVINAAAVRHFGANFFAALNARKQPRFAAGGLAAGGEVPIAGVVFPGGAGDKTLLAIEQNTQVLTKLVQTVDGLVKKFDETFTKISEKLDEKFDSLDQKIDGLIQTVSGLSQQVAALAQAIGQKSGKALGGLLGGRGSGTSDSNLAWVSRGEHIMPAHTVAQPGVLAFLEALRRSGGNLRGVLDGMGRFALGGMIRGPMPAFAGGGLAGGNLGTLTLGLPSGGSVSVRASASVVDQLRQEAALAQVRSGGRKPSRYS